MSEEENQVEAEATEETMLKRLLRNQHLKHLPRPRAMGDIIREIEDEQLKSDIPAFEPGDTVVVNVNIVEGQRERVQAYEGLVIAKRNRGLNSAFTVRKISSGEGVERVFQTHSPAIASIKVKRRGDVRRAKLYYIRDLEGRAARIKEKLAKR